MLPGRHQDVPEAELAVLAYGRQAIDGSSISRAAACLAAAIHVHFR